MKNFPVHKFITILLFLFGMICCFSFTEAADKPNIIFILADDIGIGDVGCYGQKKIQTPNIDRLAREGIRFTQGYSGTSVCAPSRSSLMTGLHCGHCPIRGNRRIGKEGQKPLPEGTLTIAKLLKTQGYRTLCSGKWGMGMFHTTGSPLNMGFDNFYGFNCQAHAHNYFPEYLYENDKQIKLDGKTYAPDLIIQYSLQWIRNNKDNPFFFFFSTTLPHGKYEIDDLGIYKDQTGWTEHEKTYAAMCSRLDTQIGMILKLLEELNLDENTIIFFAGDNGSALEQNSETFNFFNSGNGFRGHKRELYEGGIRQAFLARWPKHIGSGKIEETPVAFWDILPTLAEISGTTIPNGTSLDGVSLLSLLLEGQKPDRDTFYWELHEGKVPIQATRWKDWKFVRNGIKKPIELYDLKTDPKESQNLATEQGNIIQVGEKLFQSLRIDSPDWPLEK
ncbi:MAG: arylsulfatase [Planctomycetaceae bacterium]|jgi:arylsulfatase A-like enzyme|nr:arylsulfatase [Planctomycetaceae bacterium]